jgi:hypothetical protein
MSDQARARSAIPAELRDMRIDRRLIASYAMKCAELAAKGEIEESDAEALYAHWREASGRHGPIDQNQSTFRVQASKLRLFVRLGREMGEEGPKLLRRGAEAHASLPADGRVPSLYTALVIVARLQLALLPAVLSDGKLRNLLAR